MDGIQNTRLAAAVGSMDTDYTCRKRELPFTVILKMDKR